MSDPESDQQGIPLALSSSVDDDVWHGEKGPGSFESWHFDALSDDGRQALIIRFHDNYPFSPRYYHPGRPVSRSAGEQTIQRYPAVSFVYSVDGKIVLNAVNEFRASEFVPNGNGVNCSVGASWFRTDDAQYGTGYVVRIELLTARKRRIIAELEWLSIETDLLSTPSENSPTAASWNIVSPRSDVSGRITLMGRKGKVRKLIHFRGTGYHDHFRSVPSFGESVTSRYWGRAHFVDCTVVFQCLTAKGTDTCSKLFLVRDDRIEEPGAQATTEDFVRNRYGLKVPNGVNFASGNNISLRSLPVRVIQSGFCEVKMVSKIRLTADDGKVRESTGITTFASPGRLRRRLIRRLSDLRIGKNGKAPFF